MPCLDERGKTITGAEGGRGWERKRGRYIIGLTSPLGTLTVNRISENIYRHYMHSYTQTGRGKESNETVNDVYPLLINAAQDYPGHIELTEIKHTEKSLICFGKAQLCLHPWYLCMFNREHPVSCNQEKTSKEGTELDWMEPKHSPCYSTLELLNWQWHDKTARGRMREQKIKRGGVYPRGVMYRHQLSDCSWLQQGHKSTQFPDNSAYIVHTWAHRAGRQHSPYCSTLWCSHLFSLPFKFHRDFISIQIAISLCQIVFIAL